MLPALLFLIHAATPLQADGCPTWAQWRDFIRVVQSVESGIAEEVLAAATRCDERALRQASSRLAGRRRSPDDALVYGAALALGPDVAVRGAFGGRRRAAQATSNAAREARRALAEAAGAGSREGALGLAALALATRDRESLAAAEQALARFSTESGDVDILTATADVALAQGTPAALELARRAAAAAPEDSRVLQTLALAMFAEGVTEDAAAVYMTALSRADSEALVLFVEDLQYLLTTEQAVRMLELPAAETREAISRFWAARATGAGMTVARRLQLHFTLVAAAEQRFRRQSYRGAAPLEAVVQAGDAFLTPLDDRGLILVRYGEPDAVIRSASVQRVPPNETWEYHGLDGRNTSFTFHLTPDRPDWVLTAPLACDPLFHLWGERDVRAERTLMRGAPVPSWPEYLSGYVDYVLDRATADPVYGVQASRCIAVAEELSRAVRARSAAARRDALASLTAIRLAEKEREMRTRASALAALRDEAIREKTPRPLHVYASLYSFAAGADSVDVIASVLVPARQLTPRQDGGAWVYDVAIGILLFDSAGARQVARDTILSLRAGERLTEGHLRFALPIRTRPLGPAPARITVRNFGNRDEGQVAAVRVTVPDYGGGALALSSIARVESRPDGAVRRWGETFTPVPEGLPIEGNSITVYCEVYNAQPGVEHSVRLSLVPVRHGLLDRRRPVETAFRETAAASGMIPMMRTISADLERGEWEVRVEVVAPDGALVRGSARYIVP